MNLNNQLLLKYSHKNFLVQNFAILSSAGLGQLLFMKLKELSSIPLLPPQFYLFLNFHFFTLNKRIALEQIIKHS